MGIRESCLLSLLLFLQLAVASVSACPPDCACKWKGGKQWVECVAKGLRTFPPLIDAGTQVLDVSGSNFGTLPPDHFLRAGLINLQKVWLSNCRLNHISGRAFKGLSNLVELALDGNMLSEVPKASFQDLAGLMRLVLSGNKITHIQRRAFENLEQLTTLEIASCSVEFIEYGAFEGLHSLEWLKLEGNKLRRLEGVATLPLGLKGLSLEDNPWECDCHLLELRLWLSERNIGTEPRCFGPERVSNQTIKTLEPENFACFPQLSPTSMYQKIGEGRNVSLLCKVISVPESTLVWLFNGQLLPNSSLNLFVETNAYPTSPLPAPLIPASPHLPLPVEKKSELLILNATQEENGTFLCVARNAAGTAYANFTLRVLSRLEAEGNSSPLAEYGLGGLPLLVSNYPNLFIILLSGLAMILLTVVVLSLAFLLCRCSRRCRRRKGEGPQKGMPGTLSRGQADGSTCNSNNAGLNGSDKLDGSGGKCELSRNLSDVSTITTNPKSSVYLLSSSTTTEGMGDSNPDLIEGVRKREEASSYFHQQQQQGVQSGFASSTLPRALRKAEGGGGPSVSVVGWPFLHPPEFSVVPSNYLDLSKYPKEYISPQPLSLPFGQELAVGYHNHGNMGTYEYIPAILYPGPFPQEQMQLSLEYSRPIPNCVCTPIFEGNEDSVSGNSSSNVKGESRKKDENLAGPGPTGASPDRGKVQSEVVNRVKVQFNTESPDEGYEDGGTEI